MEETQGSLHVGFPHFGLTKLFVNDSSNLCQNTFSLFLCSVLRHHEISKNKNTAKLSQFTVIKWCLLWRDTWNNVKLGIPCFSWYDRIQYCLLYLYIKIKTGTLCQEGECIHVPVMQSYFILSWLLIVRSIPTRKTTNLTGLCCIIVLVNGNHKSLTPYFLAVSRSNFPCLGIAVSGSRLTREKTSIHCIKEISVHIQRQSSPKVTSTRLLPSNNSHGPAI